MNEVSYFYLSNNKQSVISPMMSILIWWGCATARDGSRSVLLLIRVFMVMCGGRAFTSGGEIPVCIRKCKLITILSNN